MKLCFQCKKENPSSTNCCKYCRAVFSEEYLAETVPLQRKLNDAGKTITLLKKSLVAAQIQAKNHNSEVDKALIQVFQTKQSVEANKYKKIVVEKNRCSKLNAQLTEAQKQKKSSNWRWIFVVLFIITCLITNSLRFEKNKIEMST